MNAVEAMDPKMDTGFQSQCVLSLEEKSKYGLIPPDEALGNAEVLGIMDTLLSCEVFFFCENF